MVGDIVGVKALEVATGEGVTVVQPDGEIEVDTQLLPVAVPGYEVAIAVLEKVEVAQVVVDALKHSVGDPLTVPVAASEVAIGDPDLVTDTVGEPDTLNDTVRDGVGVKVLEEDVVTVPQLDGVIERDTLGVPDIVPDKVTVGEWVTEEHTDGDKLGVTDLEAAFEVATGDPEPDVHTV